MAAEKILPGDVKASPNEASRPISADTSRRVLRLVGVFRLLVGMSLLAVAAIYQDPPLLGSRFPTLFLSVAAAYSMMAGLILYALSRASVTLSRLVPLQVAGDILAVVTLMYAGTGVNGGIGALLVVFVGAASLRLKGREAFFAAAIAALAILAQQLLSYTQGATAAEEFIAAGVLGAIIFVIASAAHPLARRIEESEALAQQRGIDLANLAQLNDYIIQNLRESIVVVDESNRIRLINQSAAEHLGAPNRDPGQELAQVSPQLYNILLVWRENKGKGRSSPPAFVAADGSMQINTYIAPLGQQEQGPVLLFLEDAGRIAEQVQQSKLAALGRLSASIAHEIRNPVGAMSHAGQLLEESPSIGEQEKRFLDIIRNNSRRISDIIESVLQLSRREVTNPQSLQLRTWTQEFVQEFSSTLELFEGQIMISFAEDVKVRMDPGQLHQVVWNLCDNAVKYASEAAGGIAVELRYGRISSNRRPYLEIIDRGPGIAESFRYQVFEPFATGRSGGTGLGLFISRELCECNGAALVFEPNPEGGSIFRIVFADPARWADRRPG